MRQRRYSEHGFLSVSAILSLLFVGVLIFLAFKLLPPYISNYQFQAAIEDMVRIATYSPVSEQEIRQTVMQRADEMGIMLDDRQVIVQKAKSSVNISVQYEVPVDLLAREIVLSFNPSAGNRNITAR
ncbi:MAG: DUF4845 domain-containing protein [Acidobacteria bacterium]|nr:DUF4845 domain-containing protein [Acidobacteriota bacterium]